MWPRKRAVIRKRGLPGNYPWIVTIYRWRRGEGDYYGTDFASTSFAGCLQIVNSELVSDD